MPETPDECETPPALDTDGMTRMLQRYRQIVETASDMLIFVDRALRYQLVNPAYAALYGTTPEAIQGHTVQEWVHPEVLPTIMPHLEACLAGVPQRFIHQGRDRNGRSRWFETCQHPVLEHGQVAGIVVSLRDVTALRQAQADLERERASLEERVAARTLELKTLGERLRLATTAGGVGIWDWDRTSDRLYWDDAAHRLYGQPPRREPLAYADWSRLVHPDDLAAIQTTFAGIMAGACTEFKSEFRVIWPDGSLRHLASSGQALRDAAGVVQRLIGVNWDITELRQAREAAQRAARARSEFLAQMSHEIRTPLHGLIGLTELALRRSPDPTTRDYLEQVQRSARDLLWILDDILDQSKLEAGRLEVECAPFALTDLLGALRTLFAPAAAARGLAFRVETDSAVPRLLVGDALRLQQVLSNLLSNALKFTISGQIVLRIDRLDRCDLPERIRLRWTVEDTGIGMDAAAQARLFQPFSQADGSIARRFGGTGLGLSIGRGLVELMGGRLELERSAPGQGSRFGFTLELGEASAVSMPSPALPPGRDAAAMTPETLAAALADLGEHLESAGGTERPLVLIVDDRPTNVRILAEALRADYRIRIATSGQAALTQARRAPRPELILLDVRMPDLDGYRVCARLKNDPRTAGIPVIFVTARDQPADQERGFALGGVDYIVKPFSLPVVRARVHTHLQLRRHAEALERLSHIDPLTGIANRRQFVAAFERECRRAMREGTPLSVLMIDIDRFKAYNDQYGHGAGDDCLCRVAAALARNLERPGDLLARYGGEEFVAILPDTGLDAARLLAERLRAAVLALRLPHALSSASEIVSISLGGATATAVHDADCRAALLECADRQLYQAKTAGRNRGLLECLGANDPPSPPFLKP